MRVLDRMQIEDFRTHDHAVDIIADFDLEANSVYRNRTMGREMRWLMACQFDFETDSSKVFA